VREKRVSLEVGGKDLLKVCRYLKEKQKFDFLSNITAVDRSALPAGITYDGKEFNHDDFLLCYHLWSYKESILIELRVPVPRRSAKVKSVYPLWRSANWLEREVYDLMGIKFDGHPDLRRILLPYGFKGHPLRKDFKLKEPKWLLKKEEEAQDWPLDFIEPNFRKEISKETSARLMTLRLGPQHPATHTGMLGNLKLEGEIIVEADVKIGYVHSSTEKIAENRTYRHFLPVSERLCWLTAFSNQSSYVHAVEEIMGVDVPRRAEYLRVLMFEMNRFASHSLWLGSFGHDLGTLSGFFYPTRDREFILDLMLSLAGNRINYNYNRFGGVARDLPNGFTTRAKKALKTVRKGVEDYKTFFEGNRLFNIRTRGIVKLSAEDAIDLGATGPILRGCGVRQDVRVNEPYLVYDELDFEIPVENGGDPYAWYWVRIREMEQSLNIIEQCLDQLPGGRIRAKAPKKVPPGEAVARVEDPRGEQLCHVISDGSDRPYRYRVRTADFLNVSLLPTLWEGRKGQDAAVIVGGMDFCMGGVDR